MAALPTNYTSGQVVGPTDMNNITSTINSVVAGTTQITLTNPTVNGYTEGVVNLGLVTTSATLDLTNGTVLIVSLSASTPCAFTMPAPTLGKNFVLYVRQPSSTGGGGTPVWPASVRWPGNVAPTPTTAPNRLDIYTFFSDGISWYGSYQQSYFAGDQDLALGSKPISMPNNGVPTYPVIQPIRRALLGTRG